MEGVKVTTVKFNVGGQLYEMARSLLDQYPTSMLSCAAAKRWQADPEATIFIEGDGERFRYCLDYMRRKKVHLPMNIPEAALMADLDYYGIQDVDPSHVDGGCPGSQAAQLHETMKELQQRNKQMMDQLQNKLDCFRVSADCFNRFVNTGEKKISFQSGENEVNNRVWKVCNYHRDMLDNCLSVYGMYVAHFQWSRDNHTCLVTLGMLVEKVSNNE